MRDAGALARLSRLRSEVAIDLSALEARAVEAEAIVIACPDPASMPRDKVIVLGVTLHAYYTALETLMERVARLLDESMPAGPTWHVDLLSQMQTEIPTLRPALFPQVLSPEIHELRKFRHFFRNAYTVDFDPARTREHGVRLVRVHAALAPAIGALQAHLEAVVDELARA
jgi:hypothetical protein